MLAVCGGLTLLLALLGAPLFVIVAANALIAFHVTPANVDTLFVYSWVLSLLVGNANIVRLSSRSTPVRTRILETIATVMKEPAMTDAAWRSLWCRKYPMKVSGTMS